MVTGDLRAMNKPDFKKMSFTELRKYVLAHREDREAWDEYANRPRPNSILVTADISVTEQERIIGNLIQTKKSN